MKALVFYHAGEHSEAETLALCTWLVRRYVYAAADAFDPESVLSRMTDPHGPVPLVLLLPLPAADEAAQARSMFRWLLPSIVCLSDDPAGCVLSKRVACLGVSIADTESAGRKILEALAAGKGRSQAAQ